MIVLHRDPFCRVCDKRPSVEVDHITPKAAGGTDELENLQGICRTCHRRKTAAEGGSAAVRSS